MKFITGQIYSWIVFLLVAYSLQAHPADSVIVAMGDYFFTQQNYSGAITEYQRALFYNPRTPYKGYIWTKLALANEALTHFDIAASFYRKALLLPLPRQLKNKLRFRLALSYVRAGKFPLATLELMKLNHQIPDAHIRQTVTAFQLMVLILQNQWKQAYQTLKQLQTLWSHNPEAASVLHQLEIPLAELAQHPRLKSPTTAQRLSTVLPGLGQMYAGDWKNGLNALLINVGTTYLLWQSLTIRSYLDLVLLGSFVWWRYYEGNRVRTALIVEERNTRYLNTMKLHLLTHLAQLGKFLPEMDIEIRLNEFPH